MTAADNAGRKAYRRSVTLLMQRAVYNLAREAGVHTSVRVEHSIGQAYYCELMGDTQVTESYLEQLGEEMRRIASEAWPIAKNSIQTDEAVKLFAEHGMRDKEKLFNRQIRLVERLKQEGKIFIFQPLIPTVSRLEKNCDALMHFYKHGYQQANRKYNH